MIEIVYDPSAKISDAAPDFKMYEISKSATAARYEIDNIPDSATLLRATMLAERILQPIRDEFRGYSPSSWYRGETLERIIAKKGYNRWCISRNLDINETSWQQYFARKSHPKGEAADIQISGLSNNDLFNWIKANLEFDQLIREFPITGQPMSGWVHVSFRIGGNRNSAFSIGAKNP